MIPEEYLKRKEEVYVDKRELANLIKGGESIQGALLEERYSLHIK